MSNAQARLFRVGIDNLKNDPIFLLSHLPQRRGIC